MCRKSITSKSATIVSARPTKVSESSSESIWVTLSSVAGKRMAAAGPGGAARSWFAAERRIGKQTQAPGDDVASYVSEPPVLCISVSPEPRERLRGGDAELHRQHAGGL